MLCICHKKYLFNPEPWIDLAYIRKNYTGNRFHLYLFLLLKSCSMLLMYIFNVNKKPKLLRSGISTRELSNWLYVLYQLSYEHRVKPVTYDLIQRQCVTLAHHLYQTLYGTVCVYVNIKYSSPNRNQTLPPKTKG